jgi:hypothetical protein
MQSLIVKSAVRTKKKLNKQALRIYQTKKIKINKLRPGPDTWLALINSNEFEPPPFHFA